MRTTKSFRAAWLVLLLPVAGLLLSCNQVLPAPGPEAGRLDLSGHDLRAPVRLDGEWEFYWQHFIDPFSVPNREAYLGNFPSEWMAYQIPGVDHRGYGSWRLVISGLRPNTDYGFRVGSMLSAGLLFANGQLIDEHGVPGRSLAEEQPGWASRVSFGRSDADGRMVVVLLISNFADRSGGLRTSIEFGLPRGVISRRENAVAYELFVVGAILAMGAYYIGLFSFRRKDYASLWFGLLCIVLALRVLMYDEYIILSILPNLSFKWLFVLGYLTFCVGAILFSAFIQVSFPEEYPRWAVRVIAGVSILYAAVVVFAPTFLTSSLLRWYQLGVVVAGTSLGIALIRAAILRRPGAGMFGLGFLVIFSTMVHDILISAGLLQGGFITQLGMVAFLFALSLNLTRLFAGAFTMAERLSGDLKRINQSLERFVPREFLGFLGKTSLEEISLGDHSAQAMALLFIDVRSFTSMAERLTPEDTFAFINEYLARTGPAVRDHGGFIDKYLGDGFMALFPSGSDAAVACALDIQSRLRLYNAERSAQGLPSIAVGIGIHCGKLMLGTIGEVARMDGTVISDVVNTASRLEGVAKQYGLSVAISEQVLISLSDPTAFKLRFIGKVRVKGRRQAVSVFEIYDGDDEDLRTAKDCIQADYERGVAAYYGKRYPEARTHLETVLRVAPSDGPSRRYMDELRRRGH